jgi:hypothetical protein
MMKELSLTLSRKRIDWRTIRILSIALRPLHPAELTQKCTLG